MTDLLRQEIAATASTIVVKVGTRVLTRPDGQLDTQRIAQLAEQIHEVVVAGRKVVLVSSGAVGAGMGRLGLASAPPTWPAFRPWPLSAKACWSRPTSGRCGPSAITPPRCC